MYFEVLPPAGFGSFSPLSAPRESFCARQIYDVLPQPSAPLAPLTPHCCPFFSRRRPLNALCMPKNQRPQGCAPLLPPIGECLYVSNQAKTPAALFEAAKHTVSPCGSACMFSFSFFCLSPLFFPFSLSRSLLLPFRGSGICFCFGDLPVYCFTCCSSRTPLFSLSPPPPRHPSDFLFSLLVSDRARPLPVYRSLPLRPSRPVLYTHFQDPRRSSRRRWTT